MNKVYLLVIFFLNFHNKLVLNKIENRKIRNIHMPLSYR